MSAIPGHYSGGITPQAEMPTAQEWAATKAALEQALADNQRLEKRLTECQQVIDSQTKLIAELRAPASTPTEQPDAQMSFNPHQNYSLAQMREVLRLASNR